MAKISLIITVRNESTTILDLLKSIVAQTKQPDEVVIVDGDSSDDTVQKINQFIQKIPKKNKIEWNIFSVTSNISKGRNLAIEAAKHDIIAITDAGCVLEKNWLEELSKSYQENCVVAGYYKGLPQTPFEEAVVPYVLVMPDDVNENTFLPATRSMLLPKKIWKKVGGFDESLTVSEDFAFAHQVVKKYGNKAIIFCKDAVVGWKPRSNFNQFSRMIFKMAQGDIRAGIYRGKVKILFGRYIGGLLILLVTIQEKSIAGFLFLLFGSCLYLVWALKKNKKYVRSGWYYLPILQVLADVFVMSGSLSGLWYGESNLPRK